MIRGEQNRSTSREAFYRAWTLTWMIALGALLLWPLAHFFVRPHGTAQLAIAAGICLVVGWASEFLQAGLAGHGGPMVGMLAGMAVRMIPPLVVCGVVAMAGPQGRQYIAFIGFLLTFYMATLAFETWSAIRRVEHVSPPQHRA